MKILLDECTPHVVKKRLPDLGIRTVQEMGWAGIKNGELLKYTMPNAHPNVATVLGNYAGLLRKMDRAAEAAKLEERARSIRANHARQNPKK